MIRLAIILVVLAAPALPQGWPLDGRAYFQARSDKPADSDYDRGLRELDARRWDEALAAFQASAGHGTGNADAALYWEAYAAYHAGRYEVALDALSDLRSDFPSSRWLKDAQALNVEVRAQAGAPVSPSAEGDDDLKLLALNGLLQSDSEKAVPMLEKLLNGNHSDKVKERALFVLTQSSSPEAHRVLLAVAHNSSNPELQLKALRLMGLMGNANARQDLVSIYKASSDVRVKREILKSFMQSGSRGFLLDVAKTEQNPELRRYAVRQLALTGGQDELWQLYASASPEEKKSILESMFVGGNRTRLEQLAKSEKDPGLRVAAIRSLGLMGRDEHDDTLVQIYQSDQNHEVREAVLQALFLQQNGKGLVDLARSEKDPQMKRRIIEKMALVHSKEVTDYMVEVLK